MNFFCLPSSLPEFFSWQIPLHDFLFVFFPIPPSPHHFSNGPSLGRRSRNTDFAAIVKMEKNVNL